jgi:hypothetical protein
MSLIHVYYGMTGAGHVDLSLPTSERTNPPARKKHAGARYFSKSVLIAGATKIARRMINSEARRKTCFTARINYQPQSRISRAAFATAP